jgi:hypothetical protein
MTVADKVARHISRLLKGFKRDHYSQEAYLYPYMNGRERGYILSVENDIPVFIFSESRGSDNVVVYEDSDWSVWIGNLTDAGWDTRKYFGYGEEEKAAKYIVSRFKKHVREYDRKAKRRRAEWEKKHKKGA